MTARTLEVLPPWALELLELARVGHLGLVDGDGRPRVMPVTFAVAGGALWSAIDDKPKRRHGEHVARVGWLRAQPRCALTVDRYDDDWSKLAWVQLLCTASVLGVAGHDDALAALTARYPHYRERPPAGPLLRLDPDRALHWRAVGDP